MKWSEYQVFLCDQGKPGEANRMGNTLSVAVRGNPDSFDTAEEEVSGDKYVVVTTPQQRKLYWESRIERWVTPRQVDPESALQRKLALEKELGIMDVVSLSSGSMEGQRDLQQLLLNVSPIIVTRAKQLLSEEVDARGRPEFEWVGLVTTDFLVSDEIRQWERACEALVHDEAEAA